MDTILSVLDQDARLTPEQVAEITGKPLGEVIDTIEQYGSYEWLIDESSPYSSPNPASNDLMKELAA